MARPVLYNFFISSASWRVRTALGLKQIDYDYKVVNFLQGETKSKEYTARNPLQQVPALVIDGVTLTQSLPIIEYLEETRAGYKVLPEDPVKRAKSRIIAEIVNAWIQPLQNPGNWDTLQEFGVDKSRNIEFSTRYIAKGMTVLEKMLGESAGKFSVGDEVSVADIFLVPQVYNAINRFGKIDPSPYPTVKRVYDNCMKEEAFIKADPFHQIDTPEDMKPN